jgi:16S rRNA A1518/A1519 N6-dimethyltransferase RsmA/KsgA/DIM1 with predicted DNA glycosylase/AP lyase activity
MNSPGPSVDSSIIIVRQLEQVSEPYHMMFEKLKDRKKQLPSQCFCKGKKNTKNTKILFLGGP